jgi:Ni2+-binding GTPase involved in maturation of urease and hydrogenase
VKIRDEEIEDLRSLVNTLKNIECNIGALDKFHVGYKIPQIGKEFDLLRLGKEYIINIEIKNNSPESKIKKQLVRNKYYLSFIGRRVLAFAYVAESSKLYFLGWDGELEITKITYLKDCLDKQVIGDTEVLDELFNPSDYLVSPFNSTKKFLDGLYFLTHQQEDVKSQIIETFNHPKGVKFFSITGSAGTGKTLLTFDIARHLIDSNKTTLVIHCGQLNDGHRELIEEGWTITAIKSYKNYDFANYDLVIVDEAQRVYPDQLEAIIESTKLAKCCCIFSLDKRQTLASWEEAQGISKKIDGINLITKYNLSEKIRTNKELAGFIKMLFNKNNLSPISSNGNVEINYFSTDDDAKIYLDTLDKEKWEVLRFTPSQYGNEYHEKYSDPFARTSHQVIGQEFDGVAIMIDRFFSYADSGGLIYKGNTYYDAPKMLFQNITRSRKRLNLVIIGNEELLARCIAILK